MAAVCKQEAFTNVTAALNGRPYREGGPGTLREAVERGDPAIKTVTFTAKRGGRLRRPSLPDFVDNLGLCGYPRRTEEGESWQSHYRSP